MSTEQDYLLITSDQHKGEKITLSASPLTIGRISPAEIIIEVESISRTHARITHEGTGYSIEDLGSSNGTFVNYERLSKGVPRAIVSGDVISIGPDIEALLTIIPPVIPPQVVVNELGIENKTYTLTEPHIRIGRQPDNDIVLANRFVSRYHAELEKRDDDYYLLPSKSISNTLLLDGQPVTEPVLLHDGAKIHIGGLAPEESAVLNYMQPKAAA